MPPFSVLRHRGTTLLNKLIQYLKSFTSQVENTHYNPLQANHVPHTSALACISTVTFPYLGKPCQHPSITADTEEQKTPRSTRATQTRTYNSCFTTTFKTIAGCAKVRFYWTGEQDHISGCSGCTEKIKFRHNVLRQEEEKMWCGQTQKRFNGQYQAKCDYYYIKTKVFCFTSQVLLYISL